MQNYQQTILSQFQNSAVICQLLANMNEYIDPSADIDTFYNNVWNIDTAVGYGLDVWGRIVVVSRVLNIAVSGLIGFEEADSGSAQPWGQGAFYGGGGAVTGSYSLPDDQYRTLVLAKALANICDCSIPAINQLLMNLFPGRGNAYCTDGLNGTMTYTFDFALTSVEYAIIDQSGVIPKPAGISSTIVVP